MKELEYISELRNRPDRPARVSYFEPFRVQDPSRHWGWLEGLGTPLVQPSKTDLVAFAEEFSAYQIASLERQMRPGASSTAGFLGKSDRLMDVVARDNETLRKLGVTHKQIADRLESIVEQGRREDELSERFEEESYPELFRRSPDHALVEGRFCFSFVQFCGYQECPVCSMRFVDTATPIVIHRYSDSNFTLKNRRNKSKIWFPGLIIHLVRDHHFFEGTTNYRLDPANAVRVLEIRPGVDYSLKHDQEQLWVHLGSILEVDGGKSEVGDIALPIEEMVASPGDVIDLNEDVRAFTVGNRCVVIATTLYKAHRPPVFSGAILPQRTFRAGVHCFDRRVEQHIHLNASWEIV